MGTITRSIEMANDFPLRKNVRNRSSKKGKPVIIFHNEDVTTLQADICVSTIHISKRLQKGRLSSCVLKKAGSIVQQEINAKTSENLQRCHRIITSPGQLTNFHNLMFVCLLAWSDVQCEEDLFQVVSECLRVASNDEFTSVAFPTLGMGELHYPPFEVSMAMLRAVGKFYVENPASTVRTVHIAAFGQNDYIMQMFAKSAIHFCKVFNKKLSEFGTDGTMLHVENLQTSEERTSVLPATGMTFWEKVRAVFQGGQYPKGELFRVKVTPTIDPATCDSAFRNAYNEVKLQYIGAES